ncbi:MAG: tRNA (adenosine(37)-N6)-threonylcarbamoyltransferase complex dimerization subunit type 1 TsaB [Rhodospirillaceae bacterium]
MTGVSHIDRSRAMRVLALETSTAACSVALFDDGHILARRFGAMSRGHAEILMPMLAEVLAEAGLGIGAIDRLAVTVGPGAFTGLRVGLAAARGLALATGCPLVGLTGFTVIAGGLTAEEIAGRSVLIAIDSRRPELFLQRFNSRLEAEAEPDLLTPEDCAARLAIGPLLIAGDGSPALKKALSTRPHTYYAEGSGLPDAAVLARLAAALPNGAGLPPRPLYLRAPDAIIPAQLIR